MDLAQQKHAIQLETKLNQVLEKNKSLEAQLAGALMKKEEAENNGKLALAKLQEGHDKEVEDIQQKHKDSQETEQRNHDSIVKEIKNELELATTELTTLKGKLQTRETEVGELKNKLNQKEEELGEVKLKHDVAVGYRNDMEKKLEIEQKALKDKDEELTIAKLNIGRAMDIAHGLIKNEEVNGTQNEIEVNGTQHEREIRDHSGTQNEREIRDDSEGFLSWFLFGLKFAVELTLGILEFWATKKHLKILITAIILATVSFAISVVELSISFKRKKVIQNKKIFCAKLPWIPQIYSCIAIMGELVFYICKLTVKHPVHVSLYTCGFHVCLAAK
ncbi:hypothetical protein M0R45_031984 [Rubus argutus]|uniref:Uncharacterized protein n=1 Tax=Rubus argutus TaxID=59490 RepID=A0AAW1WHT6_RUBAR